MTEQLTKTNFFDKNSREMQYFLNNETEMKPVLDGFLYETETMLFYGASGSGKSLFSYALAEAVSNGFSDEFLGIKKAEGEAVLYLDGEMHINSIAKRVKSLGAGIDLQYFAGADTGVTIDLTNEVQANALVKFAEAEKFKLVVLDSIRTLFDLTDENNAEAWKPVNDLVMRLRSVGCSVIAVHHTTKEAFRAGGEVIWSGSSNAVTVFDRTCGIERVGDDGGYWSLSTGFKEGRSGDGWSDEVKNLCFTVGDDGLEVVNHADAMIKEIDSYLDWLEVNLQLKARDKVFELNKRLSLGIGIKPTVNNAWDSSQHLWEMWSDEQEGITISNKAEFEALLKSGKEWCSS